MITLEKQLLYLFFVHNYCNMAHCTRKVRLGKFGKSSMIMAKYMNRKLFVLSKDFSVFFHNHYTQGQLGLSAAAYSTYSHAQAYTHSKVSKSQPGPFCVDLACSLWSAWVSSRCSGFLPPSNDMPLRLIGESKLHVGMSV